LRWEKLKVEWYNRSCIISNKKQAIKKRRLTDVNTSLYFAIFIVFIFLKEDKKAIK